MGDMNGNSDEGEIGGIENQQIPATTTGVSGHGGLTIGNVKVNNSCHLPCDSDVSLDGFAVEIGEQYLVKRSDNTWRKYYFGNDFCFQLIFQWEIHILSPI